LNDLVLTEKGTVLLVSIKGRADMVSPVTVAKLRKLHWVSDVVFRESVTPKKGLWIHIALAEPVTAEDAWRPVNVALGLLSTAQPAGKKWLMPAYTARIINKFACNAAIDVHGWTNADVNRLMHGLRPLIWVVASTIKFHPEGGFITFDYDWPDKSFDSKLCDDWITCLIHDAAVYLPIETSHPRQMSEAVVTG
jgi:hypothetical protein